MIAFGQEIQPWNLHPPDGILNMRRSEKGEDELGLEGFRLDRGVEILVCECTKGQQVSRQVLFSHALSLSILVKELEHDMTSCVANDVSPPSKALNRLMDPMRLVLIFAETV